MQANLREIKKHRRYSDEFKKEIVIIFESGQLSVLQIEKLYGVSAVSVYKWIYKFSAFNEKGFRVVEMKQSSIEKLKELERKVKELEHVSSPKNSTV